MQYTYLLINLLTLAFPLLFTFHPRIAFYRRWKALLPAIVLVASAFIAWDHVFAARGIWSFNPRYVTGIFWGPLPMEEILFFFTVPYACLFIYHAIRSLPGSRKTARMALRAFRLLFPALLILGLWQWDRPYTMVVSLLCALVLGLHALWIKADYLGDFLIAYLWHLIPFFLVNGLLTALPVVTYAPEAILGIRLYSIPVEDALYSLLLLITNVTVYEFLARRLHIPDPAPLNAYTTWRHARTPFESSSLQ